MDALLTPKIRHLILRHELLRLAQMLTTPWAMALIPRRRAAPSNDEAELLLAFFIGI